jgi:hypothetical protein
LGVKAATYKPWSKEEINLLKTSKLQNSELVPLLPGRTLSAITHKRSIIGAGVLQRGLRVARPGNRVSRVKRNPLPEMIRGSRIKNIKTGVVYRICGVHMDAELPYVWLDRVDTMFSKLLKREIKDLAEKYEGLGVDVEPVNN